MRPSWKKNIEVFYLFGTIKFKKKRRGKRGRHDLLKDMQEMLLKRHEM